MSSTSRPIQPSDITTSKIFFTGLDPFGRVLLRRMIDLNFDIIGIADFMPFDQFKTLILNDEYGLKWSKQVEFGIDSMSWQRTQGTQTAKYVQMKLGRVINWGIDWTVANSQNDKIIIDNFSRDICPYTTNLEIIAANPEDLIFSATPDIPRVRTSYDGNLAVTSISVFKDFMEGIKFSSYFLHISLGDLFYYPFSAFIEAYRKYYDSLSTSVRPFFIEISHFSSENISNYRAPADECYKQNIERRFLDAAVESPAIEPFILSNEKIWSFGVNFCHVYLSNYPTPGLDPFIGMMQMTLNFDVQNFASETFDSVMKTMIIPEGIENVIGITKPFLFACGLPLEKVKYLVGSNNYTAIIDFESFPPTELCNSRIVTLYYNKLNFIDIIPCLVNMVNCTIPPPKPPKVDGEQQGN